MKLVAAHNTLNKLERLLTLYYNIYQQSKDEGFYYENDTYFEIENELTVSRLTGERYINILLEAGRIYIDYENEYCRFLRTNMFSSLGEVCEYIQDKEQEWVLEGKPDAEKKRLLHLIRLIGWLDLFLDKGEIAENEIKKYYINLTEKRKIQRDFATLRGLDNIHLKIKRVCLGSENIQNQWYYVVKK